jgi:hypothetical protein
MKGTGCARGTEREKQGLGHGLHRTRKGGGATPGELRPSMAIGASAVVTAFKGETT